MTQISLLGILAVASLVIAPYTGFLSKVTLKPEQSSTSVLAGNPFEEVREKKDERREFIENRRNQRAERREDRLNERQERRENRLNERQERRENRENFLGELLDD